VTVFATLPSGFAKLHEVVEAMGQIALVAPKHIDDIGVRMRKLYARARESGYAGLSRGALRRLPYAMWLKDEPALSELHPELVRSYWAQHLPTAIKQPRTAKRWLGPLLYTYCHGFNRQASEFRQFAQQIVVSLPMAQGPFADVLRRFQVEFRMFTPDDVGGRLGVVIAKNRREIPETLAHLNLWPGFLDERIGAEAFRGALSLPQSELEDEFLIHRLQIWSRTEVGGSRGKTVARYPDHRVALADALISPWHRRQPNDLVRIRLMSFFMQNYGDPRLLSGPHQGHHWQGVSDRSVQTVKRWLVGDTLRGFMGILESTADSIWRYRQKFWMAYYERGHIDEAWLALGSDAARHAQRVFRHTAWAQYGTLGAGAQANQSVLFLRIGHIVFMEWSHNGSLRACVHGDAQASAMYLREYSGHDLRNVESMDFHNGMNQQPQLAHMNSEGGTWQRKARDFIADHTGVRLNDRDIVG